MPEYRYHPIDLDRPAIRLFQLTKGGPLDDIQGDLFDGWTNQSEGGIPYDALSYTWGSTDRADKITINGNTMHVTSNLYEALQHLRLANEDRILWIDAICIDQDNQKERCHQVQHMSSIYKEAEQVVIWLGLGTPDTDLIMDSMKRLQRDYIRIEGDWRPLAQVWMRDPGLGGIIKNGDDRWHKGMNEILMRPWFQRIWILQEIANARAATVICGQKSVSARAFAQIPSIIGLKPESHCQAVLDIMPGLSRQESWWSQDRNLYTLLIKFRESKATDERDVIYALLGLSSDALQSDVLFPDYGKSLQQVIQDATLFLLGRIGQDNPLHNSLDLRFLDWTLSEFLSSLDSFSSAVLESASKHGQEEVVRQVLERIAELEDEEESGLIPLSHAAENGHKEVVRLLFEKGARPEYVDKNGRTSISYAAENGHEAVVRLLFEKGARPESEDRTGRTPLSYAAGNGHDAVVRLLLEKGARSKSEDGTCRTPLSYAAENGHDAVVRLLLEKGAWQKYKDRKGRTPISYAAENGHEAVVRLLLEKSTEI